MTNLTTPPDDATPPPPTHLNAGARDPRPRAAIAIWALVVALVLAVLGTMGMVWIVLIPAAILGLIAMVKINPQEKRGQGMAVAALVITVLAGSCQYMGTRSYHDMAEGLSEGVMSAVASEEAKTLDAWLTSKAFEAGAADRIRARYAKVAEKYGPYAGEVDTGNRLLGVLPLAVPPADAKEIGAGEDDPRSVSRSFWWVKAKFRDGIVHVEVYIDVSDEDEITSLGENPGQPARVVEDVYFYGPPNGE